MIITKTSTERIQKTEAIKFVILICNPRTCNLSLSENWLCNHHFFYVFHPEVLCKYTTSVDNTTLYLYTKIVYFVRVTCFDLIRLSSGPPRRQIQELFMFHCIVGYQILPSFVREV